MGVRIQIHPFIRHIVNNQEMVEVEGSTVGQCLDQLVSRFPETRGWLFRNDGSLNEVVDIFVNGENAFSEGLDKPVKNGDILNMVIMITGG